MRFSRTSRATNGLNGLNDLQKSAIVYVSERIVNDLVPYFRSNTLSQISKVVDESGKSYPFIGAGCGFTILSVDKRKKKLNDLVERLKGFVNNEGFQIFSACFTAEEKWLLERLGNPLGALYSQDIEIDKRLKSYIVRYCSEAGLGEVQMRTYWD